MIIKQLIKIKEKKVKGREIIKIKLKEKLNQENVKSCMIKS